MIGRGQRTTAILGALALALFVFVLADREKVSDAERKEREGQLFPAWRRDDAARVELEVGGKKAQFARVRTDAAGGARVWTTGEGGQERADDSAVDKLLSALEHARPIRKVEPGAGLGLESPRARVRVVMGAIEADVVVGAPATTPEGAAYARVGAEAPVVISRELAAELTKPLDDYRERRLSDLPALEADAIVIERAGATLTLVRGPSGERALVERGGARVARAKAEPILLALDDLKAERFLAARPSPPPADAIRLRLSPDRARPGEPAMEAIVGGACPGAPDDVVVERVRPRPVVACVAKGPAAALAVTADELMDVRLTYASFDEIVEMRLETDEVAVEVARKGNGFFMRSPEGRELTPDEADAVASDLRELAKAEALSVTAGGQAQPADAVGRLKLVTVRGDESVQIARDGRLFREADKAFLAPKPALVRRLALGRAVLRPLRLFSRELAGAPPSRVAVSCRGFAQSIVRAPAGYRFEEPKSAAIDGAAALALAEALAGAKADLVAAKNDDRTNGVDEKCFAELAWDGDAGAITRRVRFGREAEGGVYARVEGDEPLLVVPGSLLAQATTPLVDREGWRVDPGAVDKLVIERDGKTRVIDTARDLAPEEQSALGALGPLAAFARPVAFDAPPPPKPALVLAVTLRTDGGPTKRRFVFGPSAPGSNVYSAWVDGSRAAFAFDAERLAAFAAR